MHKFLKTYTNEDSEANQFCKKSFDVNLDYIHPPPPPPRLIIFYFMH